MDPPALPAVGPAGLRGTPRCGRSSGPRGHGLSAPRPGLPGGASAAATRGSAAGARPGAGREEGKATNSLSRAAQRPPPTGNAAEVGSWRAAPRSLQKAFRPQARPPGDQNLPGFLHSGRCWAGRLFLLLATCSPRASASAPAGTQNPEMDQRREGFRGRCPSSSSFPQSGLFRDSGLSRS